MRRWCRVHGLDDVAALDVIQDAWMSVARGLASFRSQPGAGAFRAWLHQIVRRRIADHRRRQGLAQPAVGGSTFAMRLTELPFAGEPLSNPTQDPSTSNNVMQQAMAIVQREVEPNTWQAFWMCVVEQRSTEDVANSLAMSPANVRQCRSRVLRRLRQALERLH
jgi:RNA polymerase sigma-70 factor (ECF subfamily)